MPPSAWHSCRDAALFPNYFGQTCSSSVEYLNDSPGQNGVRKVVLVCFNRFFWLQLLVTVISTCLQMAVNDGAKSIAFPTVGCGRLGYDVKDVVESLIRSQRQNGSTLLVKITVKRIWHTHCD